MTQFECERIGRLPPLFSEWPVALTRDMLDEGLSCYDLVIRGREATLAT